MYYLVKLERGIVKSAGKVKKTAHNFELVHQAKGKSTYMHIHPYRERANRAK